jgi:hypothetical protein
MSSRPAPVSCRKAFSFRTVLTRVCVTEKMKMLSRNKLCLSLLAALAAGNALPAFADEASKELDPVVVTADRAPVKQSETLASVTVLTREDIEQSQAPDLMTLLSRQAGIDVARTGGPGQASTVFVRGGSSTHALVLIDGVRVNPATQGAPDFAHLPLHSDGRSRNDDRSSQPDPHSGHHAEAIDQHAAKKRRDHDRQPFDDRLHADAHRMAIGFERFGNQRKCRGK